MSEHSLGGSGYPSEDVRQILPRLIPPLVHRLNNSLTVVAGAVAAAVPTPTDGEFERMRSILTHLSLVSRPRPSGPAGVERFGLEGLVDAVEALVGPLASSVGVELECRRARGHAVARADWVRLEQALVVLAADAVSELEEAAARGARARLRFRVASNPRGMVVSLTRSSDPASDPTPSTAVRRAADEADQLGMQVLLRSLGHATCTRLDFPGLGADASPVPERTEATPRPSLFLFERDAELRDLISTVLVEAGYHVRTATDVADARELVTSRASLLLLDSDLERLRPDLVGELCAHGEVLRRTLFLGERPGAVNGKGATCLRKPFRPNELLAAVEERLT